MKPENESLLFERHPKLLIRENLPYGLAVGDGWFSLFDQLCTTMQAEIDAGRAEQAVFVQVKEKWGNLRFYIDQKSDPVLNALRVFAQDMSEHMCEVCGAPSHTKRLDTMVRCFAHRDVRC